MGNTQRLFFALWPHEQLRANIAKLLNNIVLPMEARKVVAANLHLTLVFVGPVDAVMRACMERAAAQVSGYSFALTLAYVGHWRRSRVAWLAPTQAPPLLLSLMRDLEDALASCNFTPEVRPYYPHITLARNVKEHLAEYTVASLNWHVEGFSLVESCSGTCGVSYRVLNSWALHGASPEPNED